MLISPAVSYANACGWASLHGALGGCCSDWLSQCLAQLPQCSWNAWRYLLATPDQGRVSHPLRWPPAAHCLEDMAAGPVTSPQALCHPPALIKGVLRLPDTFWGDSGGGSSGHCRSEMLISHRQRIISSHISRAEAVLPDLWAMLGYQCYRLAESSLMKD